MNEQTLAALFTNKHDRDDLVGTINIKQYPILAEKAQLSVAPPGSGATF